MDPVLLSSFADELQKIAGFRDLWQSVLDLFRPSDVRVQRRVDYFFSPKAGKDKWNKLLVNVGDKKFVESFTSNPLADDKLVTHVKSMHELARGKTLAKIPSDSSPGKTYEIRQLGDGTIGCQCGDWRYKGSVTPGYQCRHIRAYRERGVA